eukprot:g4935.t1
MVAVAVAIMLLAGTAAATPRTNAYKIAVVIETTANPADSSFAESAYVGAQRAVNGEGATWPKLSDKITVNYFWKDAVGAEANSGIAFNALKDGDPSNAIAKIKKLVELDGYEVFIFIGFQWENGAKGIMGDPVHGGTEAYHCNQDVRVEGTFINAFWGVSGVSYVNNMISKYKVDVVFVAAGGAGDAMLQAATDAGAFVIGVDSDQYLTTYKTASASCDAACISKGRNLIITSAMKAVDTAVYNTIKEDLNGEFKVKTTDAMGSPLTSTGGCAGKKDSPSVWLFLGLIFFIHILVLM